MMLLLRDLLIQVSVAFKISGVATSLFPNQPSTTVILFSVRVPVLSEQIVVALPIVSQAARDLIEHLSSYIFFVEYAREMVTASGSPSGIATTTMVTARMKAPMNPELSSFLSGLAP